MITLTTEQAQQIEEALKLAIRTSYSEHNNIKFEASIATIRAARSQDPDRSVCQGKCENPGKCECFFPAEPVKQEPLMVTPGGGAFPFVEVGYVGEFVAPTESLPAGTPLCVAPVEPVKQESAAWKCACGANLYIDSNGAPASKAEQVGQHPMDYDQGFVDGVEAQLAEPVRKCDGLLCNDCGEYKQKYKDLPGLTEKDLPGLTEKDLCVCEQAEQEPYAYEVWDANDQVLILIYASCLKEFYWIEQDDIARKLYTHPVRTKDLSDYEISAVIGCSAGDIEKIGDARAVIAADRSKNK